MHSTDLKHCQCETGKTLIWCQQKHDWCSVCFHACWWCYWIWNDHALTIQKRVLDRTCMLPSKMPKKYGTYKYSNISCPGTENYRPVIQLTVLRHTENEFEECIGNVHEKKCKCWKELQLSVGECLTC